MPGGFSILPTSDPLDSDEPVTPKVQKTTSLRDEGVTLPVVGFGLLLGCLLTFSNMYFGLQTGWVTMGSLQSALLGFGLCKLFRVQPFGPQENVMLQTTVCFLSFARFDVFRLLLQRRCPWLLGL
jgi:hypothetical protein